MKQSAGLLVYRWMEKRIEVFLVHPGGPYFRNKDAGYWTIPKGEFSTDEAPLAAAVREFEEETGHKTTGNYISLHPVKQKGGKEVLCWAIEGAIDVDKVVSNTFEIEWPPRSGKRMSFPEIDKAMWFTIEKAKEMINEAQVSFLEQLCELMKIKS